MGRKATVIPLFLGLTVSAVTASARTIPNIVPLSVRVYSDVCQDTMTDDVLGLRIILMRTFDADVVLFQQAEGGSFDPPIPAAAHINKATGAISFSMKNGDYDFTFNGTVSRAKLVGTIHWQKPEQGEDQETLLRVREKESVHNCYH
ncbi:MAG: hypothetical protein WCA78_09235 [Rhizomicrobium sp.]